MNRSNKPWVKMFQKLEDICTDIDKFVCKEPVQFVGNQMETVGANVKSFFTGFGDDFGRTQVVDRAHVAKLYPSECSNLVESSTNSVVEIEENTVDSNTNNPEEAPLAPNTSSTDLHHSEQVTSDISQTLVGESDNLINETSDNSQEAPLAPEELCDNTSSSDLHLSELVNSEISQTLIGETDSLINETLDNPQEAPLAPEELCDNTSSIDLCHSEQVTSEISQTLIGECDSLINGTSNNPEEAPLAPEELCDNTSSIDLLHSEQVNSEISQTLIVDSDSQINETSNNTIQVYYDESLQSDATAFEDSDLEIEYTIDLDLDINNMLEGDPLMNLEEKIPNLNSPVDEPECDSNTSNAHQSSELESSVTCHEDQEEKSDHIIAGGLSYENIHESLNSSFKNFNVEPDTFDCESTEPVDYFSVSSDSVSSCGSFTTIACDSGNEADVSCSGTGKFPIIETLTEVADGSTVDFEDIKYDSVDNDVIVEAGKLYMFPNTSRSKSYKKMLQDAFMSRKRLTKEYKQLAILYGDIDKELSQPTESSKPRTQDLPDSEWELL